MNDAASTSRPKRSRHALRLSAWLLAVSLANLAFAELRSPLEEASAIQQQLRSVVDQSARSVFAVTAFTRAPENPSLFASQVDGPAFATIAEPLDRSCGSAFAIDAAGHLVTNEHVVSGAQSVWVTDDAGRVLPAVVLGTDPRTDLAVLQIPVATAALDTATLPPSRGDLVVAIGNPDGLATDGELSASVGCVSAIGRSLPTLSARERRSYADLLQVTTPVAVGGSGGPLVDLQGRAIGVVSAVATADRDGMPVGFAIPLTPATLLRIAKLSHGEEIVHAYFGVAIAAAPGASTRPADESLPRGARIDRVEADTPADGVLCVGDLVTSLGGQPVTSDRTFLQLAGACQVEQPVPMTIRRDGATLNLFVRPTRRPLPAEPVTRESQRLHWAGVTFANADGGGVVIAETSAHAASPLVAGSIVRAVNGERVADVAALAKHLYANLGRPLELDVR